MKVSGKMKLWRICFLPVLLTVGQSPQLAQMCKYPCNGKACSLKCTTQDFLNAVRFNDQTSTSRGSCAISCSTGITRPSGSLNETVLTISTLDNTTDNGPWTCSYGSDISNTLNLNVNEPITFDLQLTQNGDTWNANVKESDGVDLTWVDENNVTKSTEYSFTPSTVGEYTVCMSGCHSSAVFCRTFIKPGPGLTITLVLIIVLNSSMSATFIISTTTEQVQQVIAPKKGKVVVYVPSISVGVVMIALGILLAFFADKATTDGNGVAPISTIVSVVVNAVFTFVFAIFQNPSEGLKGAKKIVLIIMSVIVFPFGMGIGIRIIIERSKSGQKTGGAEGNSTRPGTASSAVSAKDVELNSTQISGEKEKSPPIRAQPAPPIQMKETDQPKSQNNFRAQPPPPTNHERHPLENENLLNRTKLNEVKRLEPLHKEVDENEDKNKKKKKKKKKKKPTDTPRVDEEDDLNQDDD